MTLNLNKIAAAKLWLISPAPSSRSTDCPRDLPYLATALYALIAVPSREVERVSCDESWRIYINPDWLNSTSVRDVARELGHVTWHLLADHAGRARDQRVDRSSAKAWSKAADAAVANTLTPDELRPEDLITPRQLPAPAGRSAEEYFMVTSRLPAHASSGGADDRNDAGGDGGDGCGSGADGIHRSHEHAPGADIGAVTTFDAHEIRRVVAIDYQQHRATRGTDPGDDLRWIMQILEPKTAWEPLLSGSVRRAVGWAAGRGDFTYLRPSRRSSATRGVVLPGQHRPLPRISVVIDTSGSVDDVLLARALGEVDGAIAALGVPGSNITIYSVDAAVHTAEKVRRARDAKLVGAGGTDLRHGLRAAAEERPRPEVIIVLTDGDTPWPASPPPGAVVIAAILGRDRKELLPTPPWAVRVECVLDD